jgi:hypothetical protein
MYKSGLVEGLPMETPLAFVGFETVQNEGRVRISAREECDMCWGKMDCTVVMSK